MTLVKFVITFLYEFSTFTRRQPVSTLHEDISSEIYHVMIKFPLGRRQLRRDSDKVMVLSKQPFHLLSEVVAELRGDVLNVATIVYVV